MTPTFQGEVQFRRYSDTSTQGASIVLALPDRDELAAFIGKEGRRFMAVLVEVGDDEKPVEQPASAPKIGPLGYWLVCRCNEPEFWVFLQELGYECNNGADAAAIVKTIAQVKSRKDVDGDAGAEYRCNQSIRYPYQKWLVRRGVTA